VQATSELASPLTIDVPENAQTVAVRVVLSGEGTTTGNTSSFAQQTAIFPVDE
jgi:hypothetical protein